VLGGYYGQRRAAAVDQRTEAIMSIPLRLYSDPVQRGVLHEVCPHRHRRTSVRTANVAPRDLAKPVIVEDDAGCVMVMVPAGRKVKLGGRSRMFGHGHLEGGSDECLLRQSHDQFHTLMTAVRHGQFCAELAH
jgi:Ala-tRNA(Pro) deacylase